MAKDPESPYFSDDIKQVQQAKKMNWNPTNLYNHIQYNFIPNTAKVSQLVKSYC